MWLTPCSLPSMIFSSACFALYSNDPIWFLLLCASEGAWPPSLVNLSLYSSSNASPVVAFSRIRSPPPYRNCAALTPLTTEPSTPARRITASTSNPPAFDPSAAPRPASSGLLGCIIPWVSGPSP